jgi:phospholipase C
MHPRFAFLAVAVAAAVACSKGQSARSPDPRAQASRGQIQHIIFVVQENRTFDNIFGGPSPFPSAEAARSGLTVNGSPRPLKKIALEDSADPDNYYQQWYTACNPSTPPPFTVGGPAPCRMNGFNVNASPSPGYTPPAATSKIYSYVDYSESKPYWDIARAYTMGDHFFMGHNSESYTAHQYIFSAQSNNVVDEPLYPSSTNCGAYYDYCAYTPWGCDSPQGTKTYRLDPITGRKTPTATGPFPCFGPSAPPPNQTVKYYSLADLVSRKAGLTWRLYAHSLCSNINGLDVNSSVRYAKSWPSKPVMSGCHDNESARSPTPVDTANFRAPQDAFLTDIGDSHGLATVTWILPGPLTSDHPGVPDGYCGPWWVAKIVDAVGKSKYWNSTVVFIFWDDWGGFYDHVRPYVVRDQEGPGFRVPFLVVSPYAKPGYITKTNIEFATLIKFVESTFGLGSLDATDATPYLNNLNDIFDFSKSRSFTSIPIPDYYLCNYGNKRAASSANHSRWLRMISN